MADRVIHTRGRNKTKRVLIVDDESIVRVTLRSLTSRESQGYTLVKDCLDGFQALEYIKNHPVELLITDTKMPGLDGLGLIRRLEEENLLPVTIVLSGYNEFELVREASRLGVYDYLLKNDLSARMVGDILEKLNRQHFRESEPAIPAVPPGGIELPKDGLCGLVPFEVADLKRQSVRFVDNLEEGMVKPMPELARRISRMAARAGIRRVYPSQYLLHYRITDPTRHPSSIESPARQMQKVWHDYMNLETAAAISSITDYSKTDDILGQVIRLLKWCVLSRGYAVCMAWDFEACLGAMNRKGEGCQPFMTALFLRNKVAAIREKELPLSLLNNLSMEKAVEEYLHILCQLTDQLHLHETEFFALFPERISYFEKLPRLGRVKELELWMNNYLCWISGYLENCREDRQEDVIQRARRFMVDNCASPDMTLKNMADYVGLNERYLSTEFTKEVGMTFSAYLTSIRLERAKRLMGTADLKMYEASDHVGYRNVEHFNRIFKKAYSISSSDYKRNPHQAKFPLSPRNRPAQRLTKH